MSNPQHPKDGYHYREVGDPTVRKCTNCGSPRHAYQPAQIPAGHRPTPLRLCPACDAGSVAAMAGR